MIKVILIISSFFSLVSLSYSQNTIYQLHRAIGDTIDQKEKFMFDLFPKVNNSNFNYAIIHTNKEYKEVSIYTKNDSIIKEILDSKTISYYQANIDKIEAYISAKNNNDTITTKNLTLNISNNKSKNPNDIKIKFEKDKLAKSVYDGHRKQELRTQAIERGLKGNDITDFMNNATYGEFRSIK